MQIEGLFPIFIFFQGGMWAWGLWWVGQLGKGKGLIVLDTDRSTGGLGV